MASSYLQPKTRKIYAILLPGILIYLLCCFVPLLFAFFYSFFNWNGGGQKEFIGLGNYAQLLSDRMFWDAFINNIVFIIWTVIGQIGIALIVAMLLMSKYVKCKTFHRTVLFFPVVLSAVVVGFLWRIIYNKDYGFLNLFLNFIGKEEWIKPWLDDPDLVITSLAIPKIWQYIGYYLVILLAAINSIDMSILDSAEIDGAVGWKKTVYIVMPLIRNTLIVTVMLCISGNMKTFDQIYVMTGGGPNHASEVPATLMYSNLFTKGIYGYGSAQAFFIVFECLLFSLIINRIFKRAEDNASMI